MRGGNRQDVRAAISLHARAAAAGPAAAG
jgi:hypothetical protein